MLQIASTTFAFHVCFSAASNLLSFFSRTILPFCLSRLKMALTLESESWIWYGIVIAIGQLSWNTCQSND